MPIKRAQGLFEHVLYLHRKNLVDFDTDTLYNLEIQLSDAYLGLGQLRNKVKYSTKALRRAGLKLPAEDESVAPYLRWQLLRHIRDEILPNKQVTTDPKVIRRKQLIGQILGEDTIALSSLLKNNNQALLRLLQIIQVQQTIPPSTTLTSAYMLMSSGILPYSPRIVRYYSRKGQALANHTRPKQDKGSGNMFMSLCYYNTFTGHFDDAIDSGQRAMQIYEKMDVNDSLSVFNLANLAVVYGLLGDFDASIEMREKIITLSNKIGNRSGVVHGLVGIAQMSLRKGDVERAQQAINQRHEIRKIIDDGDLLPEQNYYALLYCRLGKWDDALNTYKQQLLDEINHVVTARQQHSLYSIFNSIEAGLLLSEQFPNDSQIQDGVTIGLKMLKTYASKFKIGIPRYLIMRGRYELQQRQQDKAITSLTSALQHATDLNMRYEQAIAELQLGKITNNTSQVENGMATLNQLGAVWDADNL